MPTHNDVAHNWAHQTGRARRGHHMYYDGSTIYSYGPHFPIARIVQTPAGVPAVLVTTARYSVSTARHIYLARRASAHLLTFCVPQISSINLHPASSHAYNVRSYVDRIEESLRKAQRARVYASVHLGTAQMLIDEHNRYLVAFKLPDAPFTMPADVEAYVAAAQREAERRRAAHEAARRERCAEQIEQWRAGVAHTCPQTSTALVRVRGGIVETSWGARVPLQDAVKLLRAAQAAAAKGAPYTPAAPQFVGAYMVHRIAADGAVRVGCHLITLADQLDAARRAGIAI